MNTFESFEELVQKRRSIKPAEMNGKTIPRAELEKLLSLGDWAPTHARTEPWRFMVYGGEAMKKFCADHAELYKANTDEARFMAGKYDKLKQQYETLSHIVITYMKRTPNTALPIVEEIAAVSAAIENILLGATASGIGALWSTGGMTHHAAMKEYLSLGEEDIVMGLLLLGYTDEPAREGKRAIPLEQKITWQE